MKPFFFAVTAACFWTVGMLPAGAENVVLRGGQVSEIDYVMEQEITPFSGVTQLTAGFVVPKDFLSPSYSQRIQSFDIRYSQPPARQRRNVDIRGNETIEVDWSYPQQPIRVSIRLKALNETRLERLETRALFPPERIPYEVKTYLRSTRQVPADKPEIIETARRLTADSETEFDAVQQILSWLVDKMQYTLRPGQFDASYSMRTGKGNCQNYSHLSAALMRAVGIPVRIVNGVTLKEPYDMEVSGGWMTVRMAQGRHSWIEVYFPDLGWVPFDPQQMQMFVNNRFIRVEVGLDNEETVKDGTIRWKRMADASGQPRFQETINARFVRDNNRIVAEHQSYGPRKVLLSPWVESTFRTIAFEAEAAPAGVVLPLSESAYSVPDTVGNLEFPIHEDFLETRTPVYHADSNETFLQKNFLVETAEYVTTQGQKYAQTFILREPMLLERIGLALHKFGGKGQIWIEVMKDDSGKPKDMLFQSEWLSSEKMNTPSGYDWVDFALSGGPKSLPPGRYWLALAYTGSPVINWFFTCGKNIGPSDGTRFNSVFDEKWSRSLSYEFNYRVIGKKMNR
jgi:hypothetical protein